MASHISHTTIDCRDAYALSEFWKHDEIARVLAIGAYEVADRRNADGTGWMVLADLEGNEFCILPSDDERTTRSPPDWRSFTAQSAVRANAVPE